MSHKPTPAAAPSGPFPPERSPGIFTPRSAWLVVGLAAGLLWVAALQGSIGVIMWLLASGSLLVVTALYALGARRRSWASLETVEQRKFALGLGAAVLVLGIVAAVVSTPQTVASQLSADAEGLRPRPDLFALPTTPAPGSVLQVPKPSGLGQETKEDAGIDGSGSYALLGEVSQGEPEAPLTGTPCTVAGSSRTQSQTEYRCTYTSAGDLAWLEAASAQQLVEERLAESQRAEAARQEERARQAANDARLEQEKAQQRAAEERARAEGDAPVPQPPAQANQPPPPDNNPPQPPPVEPPVGPPVEPPPEPPTDPPADPPTPPPNPDPTVPPPAPPTPPGPPGGPVPGTPDPDIPVIPPEFPGPPSPPARERPVQPPSSFAPPSPAPAASEAAADQVLPAAR